MRVCLLGSTEVDTNLFAEEVHKRAQIGVNREVDQHPFDLPEGLQFLTQIGTFSGDCSNVSVFLRESERELTFLHYVFFVDFEEGDYYETLKFLRFSELNFVAMPGRENLAVLAGNLRQWTCGCLEGTNSSHDEVVEFFDRIFILLAEVQDLAPIFKRFHRDTIRGSHLFRLRKTS